jgi:cysteine desulfurase/selenocysteine lyase
MVPWQELAKRRKAILRYVGFNPATGKPRWETLPKILSPRTKVVAFGHASNSLGTINPVAEVIAQVRKLTKAVVLVDAAQGVPHLSVDVSAWDCDFLIFSAYKMLGPTGLGILYGKKPLLEAMDPFNTGGDMIREVCLDSSQWNDVPWKFEAGTPNIADVIAFGEAIRYLNKIGLPAIREHELQLTRCAMEKLSKTPGVALYGTKTAEERSGIVSFNIEGIHTHDAGTLLARENVAVRVGHHCNMPLMCVLKVMGTTRASVYLYNTLEEIDRLAAAVPKVQQVFA